MPQAITFRVDHRQLDASLRRLLPLSRKLPSQLVNQKSYRINQKATWYAPIVPAAQISAELGESKAMELHKLKSGRFSKAKRHLKSFFRGPEPGAAPLLALIIQARSRKSGLPSPWKGVNREEGARRMLQAMRRIFGARQRSRAYFKACFATIRDVFKFALPGKLPPSSGAGSGPKSLARDRGRIADGTPATGRGRAIAKFWLISPRHDIKSAIFKYAEPPLQRAFNEEAEDTWRRAIELEYREACRSSGIRTK